MKSQKRNIETPIKSWFFEIDKITEPVARLITKKKKKRSTNYQPWERRDITTCPTDVNTLGDMNKVLRKCRIPKRTQEETGGLNISLSAFKI